MGGKRTLKGVKKEHSTKQSKGNPKRVEKTCLKDGVMCMSTCTFHDFLRNFTVLQGFIHIYMHYRVFLLAVDCESMHFETFVFVLCAVESCVLTGLPDVGGPAGLVCRHGAGWAHHHESV